MADKSTTGLIVFGISLASILGIAAAAKRQKSSARTCSSCHKHGGSNSIDVEDLGKEGVDILA